MFAHSAITPFLAGAQMWENIKWIYTYMVWIWAHMWNGSVATGRARTHLNITNSVISVSRTISSNHHDRSLRTQWSDFHNLYQLNITNSIISVSRTVSSKHHERKLHTQWSDYHNLYHLNITNSIISVSRTLSSKHHHQTLSSKYHELYSFCVTNPII